MLHPVPLEVDLQGKQEGEQELVFLIQPTGSVLVHLIGHVLDDAGNPLAGDGTSDGPGERTFKSHLAHPSFQ